MSVFILLLVHKTLNFILVSYVITVPKISDQLTNE